MMLYGWAKHGYDPGEENQNISFFSDKAYYTNNMELFVSIKIRGYSTSYRIDSNLDFTGVFWS